MVTFDRSAQLRGAQFVDADLSGARFVRSDLSGAVMRGVELQGADLDAPWLSEPFLVNGVDVVAFVDAELDKRSPGRELRRAADPEGLRFAWDAVERTWAATLDRAAAMPPGSVDVQVDGEWSFAQTLRHLVMATDVWLRKAVLGVEQPYDPIGVPNSEYESDGHDPSVFSSEHPTYDEVLASRAEHVALVRDFIANVTADELEAVRANPWAPEYPETTLSCLHTILEEEWEHHRYAVRDLAAIESRAASTTG